MKIISLNIRHGARGKLSELLEIVDGYNADVFIFGEYHANHTGERIKERMSEIGFTYSADGGQSQNNKNGVGIFSKQPFDVIQQSRNLGEYEHRLVEVNFNNIRLVGVYFPNKEKKKPLFEYLMNYSADNNEIPSAIIGDFNTCKEEDMQGGGVKFKEYMYKFEELGWLDAWRKFHPDDSEYSWYSRKRDGGQNGFRLDHVICTQSFANKLTAVEYCHKPRESGFTDHSAIIIDYI